MEILKLLFERAEALNGYWNLYIVVALGVLGLMASGKSFTRQLQTKSLLTLAFAAFAAANLWVLVDTNHQRVGLLQLLEPKFASIGESASPHEDWELIGFHILLDLVVISCIWFVKWHSSNEKDSV